MFYRKWRIARLFAGTETIVTNGVFELKLPYSVVATFSTSDILGPYQKTLNCQKNPTPPKKPHRP